MSTCATPNQVRDVIVQWHEDTTNPIEIDLQDPSYLSDHYVAKMLSWLTNINTGSTEWLPAMEKLVSESATRDRLATATISSLITQYQYLLEQLHAIHKLAQEDKSQIERMSYNQYALLEQNTRDFACQVDRAFIAIRQESQESFTQI
jgi:hypothetical protein